MVDGLTGADSLPAVDAENPGISKAFGAVRSIFNGERSAERGMDGGDARLTTGDGSTGVTLALASFAWSAVIVVTSDVNLLGTRR